VCGLAAWSVWSLSLEARFVLGVSTALAASLTGVVYLRNRHRGAAMAALAIAVLALAFPIVLLVLLAGSS